MKSIIKLLRPKQWLKNFFVFAAVIFSRKFFNPSYMITTIQVFIAFCLAASSVYVFNDIIDAEKDRQHPEKKFRPIASGKIKKRQAIELYFLLILVVILLVFQLNRHVMYILLFYIGINVAYSLLLKNIVIIDVMIITLGFVLRVESGSVACQIHLSPWLILCTILISLFLAINKRKGELLTLKEGSSSHRKILNEYSIEFIDKMETIVTPSILISYCLYTFQSVQGTKMMLTIPFILYGIFRYQYLVIKDNVGGKPEDLFFKDIPFLINIVLWILSVLIILYLV